MKFILPKINETFFGRVKKNLTDYIHKLGDIDQAYEVSIRKIALSRTWRQNKMLQDLCADISNQVIWHDKKLSQDEWRWMFVATYRKTVPIPNLEGTGFIILGQSSKDLKIKECNEVILIAEEFGATHGVTWSYNGPTYYKSSIDPD